MDHEKQVAEAMKHLVALVSEAGETAMLSGLELSNKALGRAGSSQSLGAERKAALQEAKRQLSL